MLEIKKMSFGYGLKKKIYTDFNLSLENGKIYGILGRNGGGKTTLLNIISTLLPGYEGSVKIDGMEAKERKMEYLQKIFVLPEIITEDKYSVTTLIAIGENYKNWDRNKFMELIGRDDMNEKTKIKALSKGQKKKLFFYWGIAINPDILILDEVTEGVDIISQKEIIKEIMEYRTQEKIVVLSSHHIEEFENIIEDFIIIEGGKMLEKCSRDEIDSKLGWIEATERDKIHENDILKSEIILSKEYLLVNKKNYSELKFSNIDLATFLKLAIDKGGKR
jgi:ABC-2 type transport system ATP-binding protein